MSTDSVQQLNAPRLCIQSDWDNAIEQQDENVWIQLKTPGNPTLHANLHASCVPVTSADGVNRYPVSNAAFECTLLSKKLIEIKHSALPFKVKCVAPATVYKEIHSKSIQCVDVSLEGLGTSSSTDGKLLVWEFDGQLRRKLEGHVGDVYCCKFFPSGLVVLSGGADMMLKIWSVETSQCHRTLIGHRQAIMDLAIVDRGRNVLSGSRDGTCKLWDCGSGTCIATINAESGQINGIAVDSTTATHADAADDSNEVGTAGKSLLLAFENGFVRAYDLRSRQAMWAFKNASAVNCCTFLNEKQAAFGLQNGAVGLTDLRQTNVPVIMRQDDRGAILSMTKWKTGLLASAADGTALFWEHSKEVADLVEFTGPDLDPVYRICTDNQSVFTCSRDGLIRRYRVPEKLFA